MHISATILALALLGTSITQTPFGAYTEPFSSGAETPTEVETPAEADGWQTTYGGTVQSVDPTAANFVPSPSQDLDNRDTLLIPNRYMPQSAKGTAGIGGFTVEVKGVPVKIPRMLLDHAITGSGTTVYAQSAFITALSPSVCNYRIEFQNRLGSRVYRTDRSPTYWSCIFPGTNTKLIRNSTVSPKFPGTYKRGSACARVYVNGVFAGEQCHSITN